MTNPITFKQAFVIVICLHIVGYVGLTQWTSYRKQARLERQAKIKELTADIGKPQDWPKVKEIQKIISIQDIKKNVEPMVDSVTNVVSNAIDQTKQHIKSSSGVQLSKKDESSNYKLQSSSSKVITNIDSTPKIKVTSPIIVPKQIQQKIKPFLSQQVDNKAIEKIESKPLVVRQRTLKPQPKRSIPPRLPQQSFPIGRYETKISQPVVQPQEYRKTYNIDGVEYIETKRVISSKITL